jgi:hypothetical protein
MDRAAICRLVDLDPTPWHGLDITRDELPACLGSVRGEWTRRFPAAILAADLYRPDSGLAEVDMYWWMNGGQVELIDVRPFEQLPGAALLPSLGAPDLIFEYSEEERTDWGFARPAQGAIQEVIFGSRGLALVLVPDGVGQRDVARLRGFRPMLGRDYVSSILRSPVEQFD